MVVSDPVNPARGIMVSSKTHPDGDESAMLIQPETSDHQKAIRDVHLDAFQSAIEADLMDRLRRDGHALISLVALDGAEVVGHVVFSPMTAPMKALGLGPVAVASRRQRQGIGSKLIREGIARAKDAGWEAVFVLGDPAFYQRFGFSAAETGGFASRHAGPFFMALPLGGPQLPVTAGRVDYAPAFRELE